MLAHFMLQKQRGGDLNSRAAWFDQVEAWLSIEGGVVAVNGERGCSEAFKWSLRLEEVVTDRVDIDLKAEWYGSREVCELDKDILLAASTDDGDDDAVRGIISTMMKTM